MKKIRVLIVDDSASVRKTLSDIVDDDPDLEVMATASDPFVAASRIQKEIPDVMLLDVEMPRMDGITFLHKIMAQRPIPVIICSSITEEGSETLLQAMEAGAVDVIAKPKIDSAQGLLESRIRLCDAIKAAARAKLRQIKSAGRRLVPQKLTADAVMPAPLTRRAAIRTTEKVICIGTSTGGTESLRAVLEALPVDSPGIAIVQHMPEKFTAAFARRLNTLCAIEVREAQDGDAVIPGVALIAPGSSHMLLVRNGARYHVAVKDGPLVSRHRPSVDVLFRSAAQHAGANAIGIILTGMGDDGAHGLLEMRQAGAATFAQDEESCVVFGMPKKAIELGAADRVISLDQVPSVIMRARSNQRLTVGEKIS